MKSLSGSRPVIPKLSRVNLPIPGPSKALRSLSFIEQLHISPVLPMICIWCHKGFGQYMSKGQYVAFHIKVQSIATVLPRALSEVVLNVQEVYASRLFQIRVTILRTGLEFLKAHHPAFEDIEISQKCLSYLTEVQNRNKNAIDAHQVSAKMEINHGNGGSQATLDADQNQVVEEEIAQSSLTSTISIDATEAEAELKKTVQVNG